MRVRLAQALRELGLVIVDIADKLQRRWRGRLSLWWHGGTQCPLKGDAGVRLIDVAPHLF
jgi:hypothetical protein